MNEWQTIAWFVGIMSVFVSFIWAMHVDAKKSLFKYVSDMNSATIQRVDRCEQIIDDMISECARKKDDFITTKAFDRFEGHLINRIDTVQKSVDHLTTRFDDYVKLANGKSKS